MSARIPSVETEEQLVSRFIGGLRGQLQNALQQFNPTSVFEAHQRALGMEQQFKGNWSTGNSRARSSQTWQSPSASAQATDETLGTSGGDKNAPNDSIAATRTPRTNALRYYNCGEQGHLSTACPKQNKRGLLVQDKDFEGEPRFDEYNSEEDNGDEGIVGDTGSRSQTLVLRHSCLTPRASSKSWLRSTLFRSTCTIKNKICKLIIDSGSCTNVISEEAVRKLGLHTTQHPSPYQLAWLNVSADLRVSKQAVVAFSIGSYQDSVECDVAPMDACHLLLGRPWEFDRDVLHKGKANTYTFVLNGRTITLLPSPERTENAPSTTPSSDSKTCSSKSLLILPRSDFEAQLLDCDHVWALIAAPVAAT